MYRKVTWVTALLFAVGSANVSALEPKFNINGFFTAGTAISDADNDAIYNNTIDDNLSFGTDSILGLQVETIITDDISITGQFVSKEENQGGWGVEADWAYFKYRLDDNFAFRSGKLRLPTYLVSDYIEVGITYPWIRPPIEVYGQASLLSYMGADALVSHSVGPLDVLAQPYVGNVHDTTGPANVEIEGDEVYGFNVTVTGDIFSVRAGILNANVTMTNNVSGLVMADNMDAQFLSAGGTLEWKGFVGYAEYGKSSFDRGGQGQGPFTAAQLQLFPDTSGWYVTAGYRVGDFLPHITYAASEDDDPRAKKQDSVTLGLRYDLTSSVALKVEVQRVDEDVSGGSAMPPANATYGYFTDGTGLTGVDPDGPTHIYSAAIDMVF